MLVQVWEGFTSECEKRDCRDHVNVVGYSKGARNLKASPCRRWGQVGAKNLTGSLCTWFMSLTHVNGSVS